MRKLILLAVLPMACIVTNATARETRITDSVKIIHANDGDVSEWGPNKFETDPELKVLYAVDHDRDNMYLAMKVTDPAMQMRIAMAGMKLFIDTRGKKKEGTGVEFPIRKDGSGGMGGPRGGGGFNGGQGGDVPENARMQQRMAFNMIVLKSFGFDDKEDKTTFIGESGGINIAFKWEEDGSLGLEYRIPLDYIGDASSLKNKSMSIGWKINEGGPYGKGGGGDQATAAASGTTSAPAAGGRGGGGGGRSSGAGGRLQAMDGGPQRPAEGEPKGQFVWTKHLMNF